MKWANFLIYEVHYDKDHSRIESVHVKTLSDNTLTDAGEQARAAVAYALLNTRLSYKTIYKKAGTWVDGEDVRAITIDGDNFIRTDSNNTKSDNLGDLAEY